ncbi:MAG TPA: hypothetical protein VFM88_22760 [Vicinamibacteria bacterium]|nr:hypothetical protein [Vicinamibacteria bacterium]
MAPLDVAREVLRPRVLPPLASTPAAAEIARRLAEVARDSVRAVVFFGSQKTGAASRDRFSAYDLFVVVRRYSDFYERLRQAGRLRRPAGLVAWLNTWLAPNQLAFGGPEGTFGKLSVVTQETFLRETGPLRRDHFCAGRLFQPAECVYAADTEAAALALEGVAQAHAVTLDWGWPWLPERFDARTYTRRILEVSLSQEIRPEPAGRADALWAVQAPYLVEVYAPILEAWATAEELVALGDGVYRLRDAPPLAARRHVESFFRRSKRRATARWLKYMLTFDGWLEYIRRKAERHTGRPIELTPRERRLPLVFLWPRVFRYLRDKDRRQ